MNRKVLMYVLAGWLLSMVFAPSHLLGLFSRGKSATTTS